MQPTAIRNLLTRKGLKKGAALEQHLSRHLSLPYASGNKIARTGSLCRLKEALATVLHKLSSMNLASANLGAGPAKKTPGKDLSKTL